MSDKPTPAPASAKPGTSVTAEEMMQAEKLLEGHAPQAHSAPSTGHGDKASHESPEAHAPSAGGKAHKRSGNRIVGGFGDLVSGGWSQVGEIFSNLRSPDRPTRRGSLFFFLSLAGLIVLSVLAVQRWIEVKHERLALQAQAQKEALERSQEAELLGGSEARSGHTDANAWLNLGQFTVELRARETDHPRNSGIMNMAEIELVVECDSKETKIFIEENMVQARSQMTDLMLSIDRDELLSREGKRQLKKKLIERLNGWIPRGKVLNAFFSKLVVA